MQKLLFSMSLAVALAGAANAALAQDNVDGQKAKEISKQDTVPPNTGENKSEQGGKAEPSAKIPGTNSNPNVFARGSARNATRNHGPRTEMTLTQSSAPRFPRPWP